MVEYLSGNRIQGSSTKVSPPPQTSWKELGRTTLGSTNSNITVSSFTAKDNIMVLHSDLGRNADSSSNEIRLNSDTNSNYSSRSSSAGAADNTYTSDTGIVFQRTAGNTNQFSVTYVNNTANKEKLSISHSVQQKTAGAGNAPHRSEAVGKWANTSDSITSWTSYTGSSDTWNTGSEVVVLGCDHDEADSGTNFWQELGTATATGSEDKLSVTVDKKYLMFEMYKIQNGTCSADLQFNGDTGSNYGWRISSEGAADVAYGNQVRIVVDRGQVASNPAKVSGFIINVSGQEKLVISEANAQDTAGEGTAPQRRELVGKWANTSSAITSVDMINPESGSFAAGSYLKVWGSD